MSEQEILDAIRSVMRCRKVNLTSLSEAIGVPYRSLQNYFGGRGSMPLPVYQAICEALNLSGSFSDLKTVAVAISGEETADA